MKQLSKILAILIIVVFTVSNLSAQSEETSLLVVSFQKIKLTDIAEANKVINEKLAPILNSLADEGKIYGWGLFNHAWGDEWNVNMWYTVKDMNAFSEFWAEYNKRIKEKQPEAWNKLRGYIQEHKDNIYTVINQYQAKPQK